MWHTVIICKKIVRECQGKCMRRHGVSTAPQITQGYSAVSILSCKAALRGVLPLRTLPGGCAAKLEGNLSSFGWKLGRLKLPAYVRLMWHKR